MDDITNKYHQARKGNTDLVVIEGVHAFKHAVRFGADIVHTALHSQAKAESVLEEFGTQEEVKTLRVHAEILPKELLDTLTSKYNNTGLVALARKPKCSRDLVGESVVFIENPNSLFNVGAIIRTLAAAGVDSFAMTGRHNPWHGDCIYTSRGLHWALKHISLLDHQEELKVLAEKGKYTIYAMDTDTDIFLKDIQHGDNKKLFLFGTERNGLSENALALANKVVKIPMCEGVSSLNLATSVAVTLYSAQ